MKFIIFAGGIGSRLWPLSRENSPKQFDKIFNGRSTIQLAFERVAPVFEVNNIFVQTVERYRELILEQLPELPKENIFIEPARRNVGPAVCYAMLEFKKRNIDGPVAILWADHLMDRAEEFIKALKTGEKLILENKNRFVFLGERPRFANHNLGWVKIGEKINELKGTEIFEFGGWKYKPSVEECGKMYKSGNYFWNPGYFITSIEFLIEKYRELAPEIYEKVESGKYEEAEKTHFDRAIIEKVDLKKAVVIKTNMGWSDPGTLYALKEALENSREENVTRGETVALDTKDCLIYNLEQEKIVAAVGLNGMVIVNTKDALIVVPKEEVHKVTGLIEKMREKGMEKYL